MEIKFGVQNFHYFGAKFLTSCWFFKKNEGSLIGPAGGAPCPRCSVRPAPLTDGQFPGIGHTGDERAGQKRRHVKQSMMTMTSTQLRAGHTHTRLETE